MRLWAAASVLVGALVCLMPSASRAGELACRQAGIVVSGAEAQDLSLACAAVRDALAFLEPMGLSIEHGPSIALVDKLPSGAAKRALGRYDAGLDAVELLDYRAAAAASECGPAPFKVPMSRALWKSYVAHEIAHASVREHDASHRLTVAQYEYVAAVVQLGTLPDTVRDEIMRKYDLPAFGETAEISDLYYYMAPCAFAVKAYRHYMKPDNGPAFVSRLLAGERN